MKPLVIITTPRTGSQHFIKAIYHLLYPRIEIIEDYVFLDSFYHKNERNLVLERWEEFKQGKILCRIFPYHLIELQNHISENVEEFIFKNFNVVYLERIDLYKQMISYLAFKSNYSRTIEKIVYNKNEIKDLFKFILDYKSLKVKYPNTNSILYFENLIKLKDKTLLTSLNNLLNLGTDINSLDTFIFSNTTKYKKNYQDLFTNLDEMLQDKAYIRHMLLFLNVN